MKLHEILSKSFKESNSIDVTLQDILRKRVKGLTRRDHEIIDACNSAIEESNAKYNENLTQINSTEQAGEYFQRLLQHEEQENLFVLLLDTKNKIIKTKKIFVGSLNSSVIHPREIFKEALRYPTASIILSHNHPSGDTTPSRSDLLSTRRIKEAGDVIGIRVLDHIIVGRDGFTSLAEDSDVLI